MTSCGEGGGLALEVGKGKRTKDKEKRGERKKGKRRKWKKKKDLIFRALSRLASARPPVPPFPGVLKKAWIELSSGQLRAAGEAEGAPVSYINHRMSDVK